MANKIQFGLDFRLDKTGLTQAKSELEKIKKALQDDSTIKISGKPLEKLKSDVEAFDKALNKAFDKDLNKLNINKFNAELKKSKINIEDFERSLTQAGASSSQVFMGLQKEVLKTGAEVKKTKGIIEDMADTLTRTAKWSLASGAINTLSGSVQKAVGYVKGMDNSLNNIRIVTGKSAKEMEIFKEQANEAAKALGKTTKEYSDASLIFFQQGKSAAEVRELTEATLIGANITGEDVSDMADYLTAAMNGYVLEANKALEVTDKLAAVGAATGSDFAELAIGMSKVASAANVMGVPLDKLNAMLATVTTVTREAPETIGTTFKTIFTRMSELAAGGEDEEGWTTGKVEEALNMIGVSVLDNTGKLRDMGDVVTEVGEMWKTLNRESQIGVSVAMAGQRQASRLISLFENWDMYSDALETSQNAQGAAMEQNIIRMDSLEYKTQQLRAETEDLWNSLLDEELFIGVTEGLTTVIGEIDNMVEGFGGLENIMLTLGGIGVKVFSKQIAGSLVSLNKNVKETISSMKEAATGIPELTAYEKAAKNAVAGDKTTSGGIKAIDNRLIDERVALRKQEELIAKTLTEQELKSYQNIKDQLLVEQEKLATLEKQRLEKNIESKRSIKKLDTTITSADLENASKLNKLSKDYALEEGLARDAIEDRKHDLALIKELKNSELASADGITDILTKEQQQITAKEVRLREILELYNLSEKSLYDAKELSEELNRIEKGVEKGLERQNAELDEAIQKRQKINDIIETSSASQEEITTQENLEDLSMQADDYERQAKAVQKVQTAVDALGVTMQLVSAISIFSKLNEESLTAEEKTNILTAGMTALSGVFLSMVPILGTLATSFGITWAAALGPIAAIVGGVIALGAVVVKLAHEFNPVNQAIKKNTELLEKQNKVIAESKTRMNDLRGTQSAFVELQEAMYAGATESGEALYASIADLDTEGYEKYVSLSNEIASIAPELVDYYDEMGNAVINLSGDYDSLIDKEQEYIRVANQAKQANRESFALEYSNSLKEAEEQIASKQRILKGLSESENGYYGGYTAGDIGSLTAEISGLQKQIKDTQQDVYTNIVDPIFSGSEAFEELTKKNKEYARSLVDTERISKKLDDPEALNRYTNIVDTYINTMKKNSEELNSSIVETEKAMKALEQEGVSEDELGRYEELKETLKELNSQVTEVSSSFTELNEVQRQNALEMASIFDVEEDRLGVLLDKVVETTISTQALTQSLSTGQMPSAVDLMGTAGMTTSVDKSAELEASRQKLELAQQEANAIWELNEANSVYNTKKSMGLEIDEELLNKRNEFIELDYQLKDTQEELANNQDEYNSKKLELLMIQQQEAELQAKLNQQFWDNVDALVATTEGYNQLADAYNASIESAGNMDQIQESLRDAFDSGNVEQISTALDEYADKIPGLGDALAEMASGAEGGFKKVEDIIKSVADQQGRMYAKMKGTDKEYWSTFQTNNKRQTALVELEYGIRAEDYANFQSYEEAINQAAEQGKRYNMDETLRNKLMNMTEEEFAAWQAENNMLSYNDMANQGMVQNTNESTGLQKLSYKNLTDAGYTSFQSMVIMAANAVDSIANFIGGIVNSVVGATNSLIAGVESLINASIGGINSILAAVGKLPGVPTVQIPTVSLGRMSGVGTSNLAGAAMDFFKPETSDTDFPDFNYGGTGSIDKKPTGGGSFPSGGGGTGSNGPSAGSGGGGGKGDSGGSEKEEEDLEWEKDIYHDINIELEQKKILLDKLQKQQDKLYGKELLDNLAQQKKALQDQQKLLEKKLEMQRKDLENQKNILANQGVEFNVDGTIANYNQLLEQKLNYVNSLSGEAKAAAKEEFGKLVEMMEAYEEMMLNSITETETAIQDSIDAQREIFLQEFEYAIQLKIEISEDLKEALDYAKDLNNEFEDMSENYQRTQEQIKEQLDLVDRLGNKLNEINNDPNLSEKERLELLEKYNEELKDAVKDLSELNKELTNIFNNTLKEGLDLVKEHLDDFKNLNDQLKHYEQTLKLIGEGDNFAVLDDIYEAQYNGIMGQINVLNAQMNSLKAQKEALEAAGMKGTDEWKAIDNAIKDTQKDLNSLAQDSLKLLQTEFKNSINEIMSSLEDAMTGGAGFSEIKKKQQELKDERKKYLDGEEKLLAVSKLQQKVQKEIDETDDPSKKAQLQKFMDTELKNLKEKDKLTKYDVDRANQVYDLTLKQMALDDQRATKNIMRLVRDTQGNWVYEFTEDAKAIEKAQEDVSSSMEKLMELDKKKLEETQDLMLKLQEEYYKEVQQIANDAANGKYKTEEEMRQALQEVTDKYNEKMVEANAEYEQVKKNATLSSMAVIVDTYRKTGDTLGNLTDEQEQLLKNLAEKTDGTYLEMAEVVSGLISGDEDSIKAAMEKLGYTTEEEMNKASSAVTDLIGNMQSGWKTNVSDMISDFIGSGGLQESSNNAIQGIMDKWKEYQDKVSEVQKETGTDIDSIKNSIKDVDKVTQDLNKETEKLINKFKDEMDAVTNLTTAYQKNREEIKNTIKDMLDYIDTINKAIDAIKRKNDTESEANKKPPTTTPPTTTPNPTPTPPPTTTTPTPPALKEGSKVRVKAGRRWYYDSYGMNPSGSTDPYANRDLQITSMNNSGSKPINVGTGPGVYLGWLTKQDLVGYDTGGYTGAWGKEGRVAMLHEKEIVLNKEDTGRILDAVRLVRGVSSNTIDGIAGAIIETSRKTIEALGNIVKAINPSRDGFSNSTQPIKQEVNINADFSGVKNSDEIEKAFENMANMASQYVNRN